MARRLRPNILITGTPGTGKSTTSELAAMACNLTHINLGEVVKEKQLHSGYDEEFDTFILNEDKICDEFEMMLGLSEGGYLVDFHSCDFFPERWFDLVVVLRTDNTILYDRLEARGYKPNKISENVECEIMQIVLDEAMESYRREIVVERRSDTVEDMEDTVRWIKDWYDAAMGANTDA